MNVAKQMAGWCCWATLLLGLSGCADSDETAEVNVGETTQLALATPGQPPVDEQKARARQQANQLRQSHYNQQIRPFLQKFCADCHDGTEPEGGVAVLKVNNTELISTEHRPHWERLLRQMRARGMPPADAPQPSEKQLQEVSDWIETQLNSYECDGAGDPGRPTIRRLNRAEYNNTIADLFGIDFEPAADFPSDDVGYGFDNIGDVLSMPPLLFEKYLAAAEAVSKKVIMVPAESATKRYGVKELKATTGGPAGKYFNLWSNGDLFTPHDFPTEGTYIFRARVFGHQAGKEPVSMSFTVDGKTLKTLDVTAVEKSPQVLEHRQKIQSGQHRVAVSFNNDFYEKNEGDRNLLVDYLEVEGPLDGKPADFPETHRRVIFCPLDKYKSKDECVRKIVGRLATRAFRRPATEKEIAGLARLVALAEKQGDGFEQGVRLAMQAVLVSPHFLFRIENDADPNNPKLDHPVNEYELATRLSYFLWSSTPDDELFQLAQRGELRIHLEKQVARMLQDPRSAALVENFATQWLTIRSLHEFTPDPGRFPQFDHQLRLSMIRETELFFAAVLRENRSLLELLDADFTFVNERLARHYGLPNIKGEEFQRVSLPDHRRGGVLTQASVLAVTSNPTRTSPVKRGKFILEQILGAPPPPPPPNVGELADDTGVQLTGTLRQRMEQHRKNPSCAMCHAQMDQLGFGFENFDAVGAWRDKDGKDSIDPSGKLPSGHSFQGPAELKAILKGRKDEFTRCLAEKLLTYSLGRGLEPYDRCAVDSICKQAAAQDYRFSSLISAIVQSTPFQNRRGDGGLKQ